MKPDYKNWVPKGMLAGFAAVVLLAVTLWLTMMHRAFSYSGKRQLAKAIVEGTAAYVSIPDGGVGLDVGCCGGALTIACAKRNPRARMIGIDRWGKEYASFNKPLCEQNARAEGVSNTSFRQGNALHLDFPDESFDAVTSNYVYHNIAGADKQDCLRETLRVLKKGGAFALHDIMSRSRYGGMVWLSIYKAADGSMDENTFADMVRNSMDSPLIRAAFKMKKKTAFIPMRRKPIAP